jgi:hypothetical protein
MHLTAFGKRLDDDQVRIKRYGITISDKYKLQFYLKQMYSLNHFNKKEMTEWENKPETDKNNFGKAKTYFEGLVKDYGIYEQNSGRTVSKNNYESANQTTDGNSRMNCTSTLLGLRRQQLPRKNRQPTSATARRRQQPQWSHKSKPWPTRLPHSQERWPTRRTYPTAVAEVAAPAAAAEERDKPNASQSNTPNRDAWVATVCCMATIPPA